MNAVINADDTFEALGNMVASPVQTGQGIWNAAANTLNNLGSTDSRVQGQAMGNILITAAMAAAPYARAGQVAGLAEAADSGVMATREGLIDVSQHLSTFGADPANSAMYSRLTTAFENGRALTGTDAAFYQHELLESSLMDSGMGARAAHLETLGQQGIQYAPGYESQLYHSTVIQQYPAWFSPAAQAAAGVH